MPSGKLQYLVDQNGRKISVVLAIAEYQELIEDLRDLALIAERQSEPSESFEEVKKRLDRKWPATE